MLTRNVNDFLPLISRTFLLGLDFCEVKKYVLVSMKGGKISIVYLIRFALAIQL